MSETDVVLNEDGGWCEEVKKEVEEVLSKFLPLTKNGGWGVKYTHPVQETYEDGTIKEDTKKATGVVMYIQMDFNNTFDIEVVNK
jgi:hypothetical protein